MESDERRGNTVKLLSGKELTNGVSTRIKRVPALWHKLNANAKQASFIIRRGRAC